MASRRVRCYGKIEKITTLDDGTLEIEGTASTEQRDDQGEIITAKAMSEAIPEYMRWGAVREMHQPTAAGTALETHVDDAGRTKMRLHVVDPVAVLKVQTGVYKGLSVGGIALQRDPVDKRTITQFKWGETSLVDVPSNPGAVIEVVKIADGDDAMADDDKKEEQDDATKEAASDTAAADAAKDDDKDKADDAAEKVSTGTKVAKGMYNVRTMADMLENLAYITMSSESEAIHEGDNSPVPAQLRAWFKQGAAILEAMTAEELAEMMVMIGANDAVKEARSKLDQSRDAIAKVAGIESEVAKLTAAHGEAIAKLSSERDEAVAKASQAVEALGNEIAAHDTLKKQVEALADEMLAKGMIRAVSKEQDGQDSGAVEKVADPNDPATVAEMIKKVHHQGGRIISPSVVGSK